MINRIMLVLVCAIACGAPDEPEQLGSLEQPISLEAYVIGWDLNDGWQGRYCGGWGPSQSCALPPNATIKWRLDSLGATVNGYASTVSSSLTSQQSALGSSVNWTGTNGTDYDIRLVNGTLTGALNNVISRYIHIACVDGTTLAETMDGDWMFCNKHEATVDVTALTTFCPGTGLEQCWKRVLSHAFVRAGGVGSDSFSAGSMDQRRPSSRYLSAAGTALLTLRTQEACSLSRMNWSQNAGQAVIVQDVCDP